ncbi:hypothetical protein SDC9_33109 [bioreactor metagenome]|uniref:PIN domain-containing protein n=1 Tax=bioreactor metagenome TaxID=1076179 RepID=A0A644V7V4_9ZZZZ
MEGFAINTIMKALLDTNIIIHRETNRIFNRDIGNLFLWLDKLKCQKCIHPVTIQEIEKYEDSKIVDLLKVKIQSYVLLQTTAPFDEKVTKVSQEIDVNENDRNDTKLLNEVYSGRVDILITEDKKLHTKAEKLGIKDKVFKINDFLEKSIQDNPSTIDYKVLSVRKEFFGNIDIKDSFFDSFREDYPGFDNWFNRKAEEKAYACYSEGVLSAFLYLKKETEKENYSDITPIFPPKQRLKIGTFKVIQNGIRLGERFLKIIFDHAYLFKVSEIYVTIFNKRDEQNRLIEMLKEWGFVFWGNKGEEQVYVRSMVKHFSYDNPRSSFPFLSDEKRTNRVFLVPIKPDYHTNLLPDSILNTEKPADFLEGLTHRNALSKVYISHSYNRDIRKGDILIFYRTGGYYASVVTTIGIVEKNYQEFADFNDFKNVCNKRTFFTESELKSFWDEHALARPFVVQFLYAFSFKKRLNLKRLIEIGVVRDVESAPRGFTQIGWDKFIAIIKEADI